MAMQSGNELYLKNATIPPPIVQQIILDNFDT